MEMIATAVLARLTTHTDREPSPGLAAVAATALAIPEAQTTAPAILGLPRGMVTIRADLTKVLR